MTENTSRSQTVHRWYTRPVFFVADVNRAARFYGETLGFEKGWHEGDGAGKVCQVNHEGARSSSARMPRVEMHRLGLAPAWYAHRDSAYLDVARAWCEANGIEHDLQQSDA